MSLPNPVEQKSYDVINNKLSRVMKEVAEESMKRAAVEENSSSPDNILTVSGDGTWKTRGHSSLIGVCTVIGPKQRKKTCFYGSNRESCTSGGRGQTSNVQASTSVRLVAEALDLPHSTVQKIMRNILRYYPYKLQFVQELLPHDFETRHLFSLQFLARLEVDPERPWNILWTDEAHFHLDGSVNTHNCRIWESDNPHSTLQVPLHSPKVTVWVFRVFYSWPIFFRGIRCWGSSNMFYHWTAICIVITE
ncbi:uncharacterized protein TNCV_1450821 [Trichonephila clavipes]|nr:uncharacterized protein TNCV_1450821 [Trichonephila clavipes]